MKTTISPLSELSRRDLEGWAELAERAIEPNPFLHPDYVGLAATALRPRGLRILRCEDAGGWAACLPVVPVAREGDGFAPGLATWRHPYCALGTPLMASGALQEAARGLLSGARAGRGVGFVACPWVREGSVLDALVDAAPTPPRTAGRFTRGLVHRPVAPTPAMVPLSRGRAKELRRQQRTLAAALGGPVEAEELTDVPRAVEAFLALEASGWKGRAGTAMASLPRHAAFLSAVCESFATRKAVQFLALRGGGRTAAMQCNFRAGEAIFCLKVAYDEQLATHAPGVQLEVAALERFRHDPHTAWMDSCAAPDNELINRLWPQRMTLRTLVFPGNRVGRASLGATAALVRGARSARRRARERHEA